MGTSTEELNRQIEDTRAQMTRDVDALQDRVSPSAIVERRKAAARSRLSSVRDSVMGTASSATDTIAGTVSGAGDSVGSAAGSTTGTGRDTVQGSPLAAGLVAFGAGMVISALLPASRKETEIAQQVVETAKEKAQPLVQDVAASAQQAGASLREDLGAAAEEVKQTATQSTERVRDEAAAGAEEVRDQAPGA